jgi:HK97 family phage major capsid protein
MTMTDTDLTAREVIEQELKKLDDLEQVLIEKGAAKTDEDIKAADTQAASVQRLFQTLPAREYLADQSRMVDGKTFDDLASASGVINPEGMTLGQAFTKSPAYLEQLEKNLKADGSLAENIGRSRSVDFGAAIKGLIEGKALVTGASQTSGGAFLQNQRLPGVADVSPLRRPSLIQLCTRLPLSGDTMEWVEATTQTSAAVPVAEATSAADGAKPESTLVFNERTQAVQTIAHWIPITRRAAADAPQLQTYIDRFLLQGLDAAIENQLVNGTGVSPQLRGILNATTAWAIQTIDISVSLLSRLDAVAVAAGQIMSSLEGQNEPTAMLVHPLDWFSVNFALAREGAGTGQSLGGGPFTAGAARQMWDMPVVVTKAVPQGTQLVGDFREALVGDREQATLLMTDSHSDFFIRNILVTLAEARLGFALRVPAAFVAIVP